MAVTLGDAIVFFRGDKRPLEQAMGQTRQGMSAWTGAIAGMVSGGVTFALDTAGKAMVGIGKSAIKAAQDAMALQSVEEAFYDIADAETLASLRMGTLGTVRDADLMRNYNNAALSVSQTFADELPNAMEYFRKISAATGEDIGYLMDSYTTGVAKLSPMILDNLKVQIDQNATLEAYADKLGIAKDALTKEQQQMAFAEEVMRQLQERTAGMPDVTETAKTKWDQFQTTLANVQDEIGLRLLPIGTKLMDELLMPLLPVISDLGDKAVEFLDALTSGDLGELGPALQDMKDAGGELLGTLGEFWDAYGPDIEAAFADFFGLAKEESKGILLDILGWITEKLPEIGQWFMDNGPGIVSTIQAILDDARDILDVVRDLWPIVLFLLDLSVDKLGTIGGLVSDLMSDDKAGVVEHLWDLWFGHWFEWAGDLGLQVGNSFWVSFFTIVERSLGVLSTILGNSPLTRGMADQIDQFRERIQGAVSQWLETSENLTGADVGEWMKGRLRDAVAGQQSTNIWIYGLSLEGVENPQHLLEDLQALSSGGYE